MKQLLLILLIISALFIVGCTEEVIPETPIIELSEPAQVIFYAEDNTQLTGIVWNNKNTDKGIVLLHMAGNSKDDYAVLAQVLQQAGYGVFMFDFRGHGYSSGESWTSFSDEDWLNLEKDVKAAVKFMKRKGSYPRIGLLGASIGANHALKYAITDDEVESLVLLSPGEEFKGVSIVSLATNYLNPVLLVSAYDDEYSSTTVTQIYNELTGEKELEIFDEAGHGSNMFETKPELYKTVADWFDSTMP
jgi:alpha-beta hydrolase superfamily lysophospholipase